MYSLGYIWAAAHPMTEEQRDELEKTGEIVFLKDIDPQLHGEMCNIKEGSNLKELAKVLLDVAHGYTVVQPAGNPQFQCILGMEVARKGYIDNILYAYSERVSKDSVDPDGTIKKISVFKHKGFKSIV